VANQWSKRLCGRGHEGPQLLRMSLGRSRQGSMRNQPSRAQRRATNEAGWAEWGDIHSALQNVREGDAAAIERCLTFLEADPRYFRSGYVKESIWRRFMHAPLTDRQRRRLEDVALVYLSRRLTREYWYMARTMAETGSHAFWQEVRRLAEVSERTPARRATMLLAYEGGMAAGERMRRELGYEAVLVRGNRKLRR
jgi:hypothetical protein